MIQAWQEELRSKHVEKNADPRMVRNSSLWNSDPSMARRTLIQVCWSKHRYSPIHKRQSVTSTDLQVPIHSFCLCWCVHVWVCLVLWCLWLIFYFCGWFLILCLWECVHQRKKQMMRALVLQIKKRERKKANLEIIKIMYRRATVIAHICMVTVALVHLCTILYPPMWVFFWSKCVKWAAFCILQDYPWTDVVALKKLERTWRPSLDV